MNTEINANRKKTYYGIQQYKLFITERAFEKRNNSDNVGSDIYV